MQSVQEVTAIAGHGLEGDRYAATAGSYNKKKPGHRQVTLINGLFFKGSGFDPVESRRNIVTRDVELMILIGKDFNIGSARFRGVKYCDPCTRPNNLCGKKESFREAFFDRGGLIAEILEGGVIKTGDLISF